MNKDDRIQGLLEANNRMLELARKFKAQLRKDYDKFVFYYTEHMNKAEAFDKACDSSNAEASRRKAMVNKAMADEISALLAQH